jgi:hypothetical protein
MFSDALSGFINAGWALPWYAQSLVKCPEQRKWAKLRPHFVAS